MISICRLSFLSFPGLTSLLAQLHPARPSFICLHGSETEQLQFPRLHGLSVRNLTSDATSFPQLQGMLCLWSPHAALGRPLPVDPVEQDKKAGWHCQESPVLWASRLPVKGQSAALPQAQGVQNKGRNKKSFLPSFSLSFIDFRYLVCYLGKNKMKQSPILWSSGLTFALL